MVTKMIKSETSLNKEHMRQSMKSLDEIIQTTKNFDSLSIENGCLYPISFESNIETRSRPKFIEHILKNDLAALGLAYSIKNDVTDATIPLYLKSKLTDYCINIEQNISNLNLLIHDYSTLLRIQNNIPVYKPNTTETDIDTTKLKIYSELGGLFADLAQFNNHIEKNNSIKSDKELMSTFHKVSEIASTLENDLILFDFESSDFNLLGAVSDLCYIRKSSETKNKDIDNLITSMKKNSKLSKDTYASSHKENGIEKNFELKIIAEEKGIPTYLISVEKRINGQNTSTLYLLNGCEIITQKDYNNNYMLTHDKKITTKFFESITNETKNVGGMAIYDLLNFGLENKYDLPDNKNLIASKIMLPNESITLIYDTQTNSCYTRNGKPGTFRYLPHVSQNDVLTFLSSQGTYGDGSNIAKNFNFLNK